MPGSLVDILRQRHADAASRLAITFVREGAQPAVAWTYGELLAQAAGVAEYLEALGVQPGARVLLLHPPGLPFYAAFLGCVLARALPVPLPHPRQQRSLLRVRTVANDCSPTLALTDDSQLATVLALFAKEPALTQLRLHSSEGPATDAGTVARRLGTAIEPQQPAFLQYTSGSTGSPKGVVVTHGNLLHQCSALRGASAMNVGDVVVTWLPHVHDMGLVGGLLFPAYLGARVVQLAPAHFLQDPTAWLTAVANHGGTVMVGPDFAYDLCARTPHPTLDLRQLRTVWTGAEPVRKATIDAFTTAFSKMGFAASAWLPCYGMAECTLMATGLPTGEARRALRLDPEALARHRAVDSDADHANAIVGCGRPMADMRIAIVAADTLEQQPDDHVGEIWIQGGSVAAGYWNQPERTAATFGARTANGEGPFLRTGDLGFLRDGQLFVTGRLKDLIKVRGRNLYPQDLEAAVVRALPGTAANGVAAFGLDDGRSESIGLVVEGDRSLVRLGQRAEDGDRAAREELAARVRAVRQAVADEAEVTPRVVALVGPGNFPRTTSGKVQRSLARQRLLDGSLAVVYAEPATNSAATNERTNERTNAIAMPTSPRRPPAPLRCVPSCVTSPRAA